MFELLPGLPTISLTWLVIHVFFLGLLLLGIMSGWIYLSRFAEKKTVKNVFLVSLILGLVGSVVSGIIFYKDFSWEKDENAEPTVKSEFSEFLEQFEQFSEEFKTRPNVE
ncbi:MAG: hypothetical protein AAB802_05385 [Patescibacteria group bacterium]